MYLINLTVSRVLAYFSWEVRVYGFLCLHLSLSWSKFISAPSNAFLNGFSQQKFHPELLGLLDPCERFFGK